MLLLFLFVNFCLLMQWKFSTGDCDFTKDYLNLQIDENSHRLVNYDFDEDNNNDINFNDIKIIYNEKKNTKYCIKHAKNFETIKFICPKKKEKYEGIEVRPSDCFDIVNIYGEPNKLKNVLKGSVYETIEHNSSVERRLFIPPSSTEDISLECICDNSLTFHNQKQGYKGIVQVHIKKNIVTGCDFDFDINLNRNSSFTKYYDKNVINNEDNVNCEVEITNKDVVLGIICPDDYQLYPNRCFENIISKNGINQLRNVLNSNIHIYTDPNNKFSFASFSLEDGDNFPYISCQCTNENTSLKKFSMHVKEFQYIANSVYSTLSLVVLTLLLLVSIV